MVKPTKTRNNGTWTEARYRSFVTSALRKSSSRWGPKFAAKRAARHPEKLPHPDTGRLVYHSKCAGCSSLVPETTSAVDHIVPVIDPHVGFVSWDDFIERLHCEQEGFQVLCKPCHDEKTKKERAIATERRRAERIRS
jgi:5-methylcytosine-specific restriction endonuclease McrA